MAITTVPNPDLHGIMPDGTRIWRYHWFDNDTCDLAKKYAVGRTCPRPGRPNTWSDSEEAALMAHAMAPEEAALMAHAMAPEEAL